MRPGESDLLEPIPELSPYARNALRFRLTAAALTGMKTDAGTPDYIATRAVAIADAVMKELEKATAADNGSEEIMVAIRYHGQETLIKEYVGDADDIEALMVESFKDALAVLISLDRIPEGE